jgi:hypothetical protein
MERPDILRSEGQLGLRQGAPKLTDGVSERAPRLPPGRLGLGSRAVDVTQPRAAAQILADAGPTLSVQDTAAVLNVSPDAPCIGVASWPLSESECCAWVDA